MKPNTLTVVTFTGLSLLALATGGCNKDTDPKTGEQTSAVSAEGTDSDSPPWVWNPVHHPVLDECETSHEFRKVVDRVEEALRELRRKKDAHEDVTPEIAMKELAAANEKAFKEASPKFLSDMSQLYCVAGADEMTDDERRICLTAVEAVSPTPEQVNLRNRITSILHKGFLQFSMSYAYDTVKFYSDQRLVKSPLVDIDVSNMARETLRAMEDINEEINSYERKRQVSRTGLEGIEKLKKSAGAMYLALACDADEAFTFLKRGKDLLAPGRGSDSDSKAPVGPTEGQGSEERSAPPAQVGV